MRGGIFESLPGESDKYEAAGDVTPEATLLPVCLNLNSAEISAENLSAESVDIPLLLYSHQGKGVSFETSKMTILVSKPVCLLH